jgi:predicted molibdopterin-dependent oxidoreductase YjgC
MRERVRESSSPISFLASAHASIEELFLVQRLAASTGGGSIAVSWSVREKSQPERTQFKVPAVDAPNVAGARDLGLVDARTDPSSGKPDLTALRAAVEGRRVGALYVLDPGPDGSIGDVAWIIAARRSGALPFLVVQGVLKSDLVAAADLVFPGASWVEKEASYTNDQGRLQGAARVIPPPGDAMEDWQVLVNVAVSLGARLDYASAAAVRADAAAQLASNPAYAGLTGLVFAAPVAARHWLQASNPSERWKWDFLFQDLPPVKFEGAVIPLAQVRSTKFEG